MMLLADLHRPYEAMVWISKIDDAKRIRDLRTSKSIPGNNYGDFVECVDVKVARGRKKTIDAD